MKNRKFAEKLCFSVEMAAILLTFALVLAGCPMEPTGDPALEGTVSITGTAMVGQTLTADTGSLQGTGTISYLWKRGDTAAEAGPAIPGATSASYTLAATDLNKYITVTVTRAGYSGSKTSIASAKVVNGSGNENGDGAEELPAASGANELSGKTYFNAYAKMTFSTTVNGAQNGTYTVSRLANGTYTANVKFLYTDTETGTYTWNEAAKTVSLKLERVVTNQSGGVSSNGNDSFTAKNDYGELRDKEEFRADLAESVRGYTDEFVQEKTGMTKAEYLDYMVARNFRVRTDKYVLLNADNAALFLDEPLPENNGINVFNGKEFTSVQDDSRTVTFTATAYSVKVNESEVETGEYRYDKAYAASAGENYVYLKPLTKEGKTVAEYYDSLGSINAGHYESAVAAKAAQTNENFRIKDRDYTLSPNTINY
ncbi:hypothetical protein FACS1894151_00920 [Spirochaetia bacterium]|nr:hypothetical protein FACS1894151_00920 [Spirochaetia bacterium]